MNDIVRTKADSGLAPQPALTLVSEKRWASVAGRGSYALSGHTAMSGTRYVRVELRKRVAWAPLEAFAGTSQEFIAHLKRHDVVVIGSKESSEIRDVAGKLTLFPPGPLIDRPGWTGPYFALASGGVFKPACHPDAEVLFDPCPEKFAKAGKFKKWLKEVAKPFSGQPLPTFVLMAAFTGPLLELVGRDGNFGFELVGAKGKGKSTLQMVMASALGRGHQSAKGQYWLTCRATVNGLEAAMRTHSDAALILDDASLFASGKSGKARSAEFNDFVFSLYSGHSKVRFGTPRQESFRFNYMLSSNERLADNLDGSRATVSEAACDRLITIPIDADRPYGVFDLVPAEFKGSAEFARSLVNAIEKHHGHAFRRFVKRLVQARHDDETGLRDKLKGFVRAFQDRVGVDPNDGSSQRVTGAFGLVYAAGMLAKDYGALPRSFKCMAACKAVYKLHLTAGKPRPFRDRLVSLSRHPDVIDLDKTSLTKMSKKQLTKPAAFLRTNRSGEREVLLVRKALMRAFPDWLQTCGTAEVQALLRSQNGRKGSQCQLRQNRNKDRAYIFVIDDEED